MNIGDFFFCTAFLFSNAFRSNNPPPHACIECVVGVAREVASCNRNRIGLSQRLSESGGPGKEERDWGGGMPSRRWDSLRLAKTKWPERKELPHVTETYPRCYLKDLTLLVFYSSPCLFRPEFRSTRSHQRNCDQILANSTKFWRKFVFSEPTFCALLPIGHPAFSRAVLAAASMPWPHQRVDHSQSLKL